MSDGWRCVLRVMVRSRPYLFGARHATWRPVFSAAIHNLHQAKTFQTRFRKSEVGEVRSILHNRLVPAMLLEDFAHSRVAMLLDIEGQQSKMLRCSRRRDERK